MTLFVENPLLVLFAVSALGYAIGQLRLWGVRLGIAAVLFVGLAGGALDPALGLPEIVYQAGLVLFVYTTALSGGPTFLSSLKRRGLQQNLLVIAVLLSTGGLAWGIGKALALKRSLVAGLYAGSLTNTPALAGVLDLLRRNPPGETPLAQALAEPVVGYAVAYPMGVIGMILAIVTARWLWRVDSAREAETVAAGGTDLRNVTVLVTNGEACRQTLGEMKTGQGWRSVFARLKRDEAVILCTDETRFAPGDLVSILGPEDLLDPVIAFLGERTPGHLEDDRSAFDYRRIVVSNREVAGRPLVDLNLSGRFGAIVTRIRRGDVDLLAARGATLELGDRIRVVAPQDHISAVTRYFGDSYKRISEVDGFTLGLGIALGLLVGIVPLPLPGGMTFRLGFATGPLLAGLILGALGRTGPIIWSLPYSANLTLRQFGLMLFLAGIGTRSGYAFAQTLSQSGGMALFLSGTLITLTAALGTLWLGHRWLRIPLGTLIGVLAGMQTQPAVLAFAAEQTDDDRPAAGYATVFPVAMVAKILIAQLLLSL